MIRRLPLAVALAALSAACSSSKSPAAPAPCTTAPVLGALGWTAHHPDDTTGSTAFAGDRVVITPASVTAACGAAGLVWRWDLLRKPPTSGAALAALGDGSAVLVTDVPADAYDVMATVTDGAGNTSDPVFAHIVTSACGTNPPAVTQVLAPVSRPEIGAAVLLLAVGEDPDAGGGCGLPQEIGFEWALRSAPLGSLAAASGLTTTRAADDTLTFTPDLAGTYAFDVTAVDSTGLRSAPRTVEVATGPCGPTLPPIAVSGVPQPGAVLTASFQGAIVDVCVAGGGTPAVAWSLAGAPAGSAATIGASSGLLVPDLPGVYTLRATVTDAGGFASSAETSVAVGACTLAPVLSSPAVTGPGGVPVAAPDVGDLLTLSAAVTPGPCAVPSAAYTWEWTLIGRPAGSVAVLGGGDTATPSLVPDVPGGRYEVAVIARDAYGNASAPAYVTVQASTCGGNLPIVSLGGPVAATTFVAVPLTAAVSDADQLCPARFDPGPIAVTWALVEAPAGAAADLATHSGTSTALVPDLPGTWTVEAWATTATGVTGPRARIALPVASCDSGPVLGILTTTELVPTVVSSTGAGPALISNGGPPFYPLYPVALSAPVATGALACARPVGLAYSWRILSSPVPSTAQLDDPSRSTPSFVPDLPGTYTLQVTVTDELGFAASGSTSLFVGACGLAAPSAQIGVRAPIAVGAPVPATTVPAGSSVQLDASSSADADAVFADVGGCGLPQPLTYAWRFLAAPYGSSPRFQDTGGVTPSTLVAPTVVTDVAGLYTVELTVSDGVHAATARIDVQAL